MSKSSDARMAAHYFDDTSNPGYWDSLMADDPLADPLDKGPGFMNPADAPASVEAPAKAEGPRFMSEDWDDVTPPREPDLVQVEGGMPLLYLGESHLIYGTGGSGKSFIGYQWLKEFLEVSNGVALLVDYESNPATVKERLKALGVTKKQAARIAYWRVSGSLLPGKPTRVLLDDFLTRYQGSFILLDSIAMACSAAGLNDNDNSDYNHYDIAVTAKLQAAGHTVVNIDHIGHIDEQRRGPVKARGASSKADRVSGSAWYWEAKAGWSRTNSGFGLLSCAKDREGHYIQFKSQVCVTVDVVPDVSVTMTFSVSEPAVETDGGRKRRTWYMEKVSDFLAEFPDGVTGRKLETHFRDMEKSPVFAKEAALTLKDEGFVSIVQEEGGRRTKTYSLIKPFSNGVERADDSPFT